MIQKHQVVLFGLLLIAISLFIISFPKPTQAEIATQQDWIGIFEVQTPGAETHTKSGTANGGTDWKYGGNDALIPPQGCTQSQSAKPWLSGGCKLSLPGQSGAYEFRLYANNQETPQAWLAQSKVVWVQFSLNYNTNCNRTTTPYTVTLAWPTLAGIATGAGSQSIDIYETVNGGVRTKIATVDGNITSYLRSPLTKDSTYVYEVVPKSKRNTVYPASAVNNKITFKCSIPFLRTSGGDVHSNQ